MIEAEAWVAVAFVLFLCLLVYVGAHRRVIGGIDARQARIKAELDEAVRLRDEAKALLAEYERKGREAESEAAAIIASAKGEAERLAAEAKAKMEDFVVRRTKMAEAKIAQAEAQALARCPRRCRRHRGRRRRENPRRRRQGQGRREPARAGHRRHQEEIQLSFRCGPSPAGVC